MGDEKRLITKLVMKATRRLFLLELIRFIIIGYAVAAPVVFVSAFIFLPEETFSFFLLLLFITVVDGTSSTLLAAKRATRLSASLMLDALARSKERITTAFWLLGKEEHTPVEEFVIKDATEAASRIEPTSMRTKPLPRWVFAVLWLYIGCPLSILPADTNSYYTEQTRLLISVGQKLRRTLRSAPKELQRYAERSHREAKGGNPKEAERLILNLKRDIQERRDEIEHIEHMLASSPQIRRLFDSLATDKERLRSAAEGAGSADAANEFKRIAEQVELDRTLRQLLEEASLSLQRKDHSSLRVTLERIEEYLRTLKAELRDAEKIIRTEDGLPVASLPKGDTLQAERLFYGGRLVEQERTALPSDAERYPEDMKKVIRIYFEHSPRF